MSDIHTQLNEWLELYVLGGLEELEKQRFDHHVKVCEQCRDRMLELHAAVDLLPAAVRQVDAPLGMRERVLSFVLGHQVHLAEGSGGSHAAAAVSEAAQQMSMGGVTMNWHHVGWEQPMSGSLSASADQPFREAERQINAAISEVASATAAIEPGEKQDRQDKQEGHEAANQTGYAAAIEERGSSFSWDWIRPMEQPVPAAPFIAKASEIQEEKSLAALSLEAGHPATAAANLPALSMEPVVEQSQPFTGRNADPAAELHYAPHANEAADDVAAFEENALKANNSRMEQADERHATSSELDSRVDGPSLFHQPARPAQQAQAVQSIQPAQSAVPVHLAPVEADFGVQAALMPSAVQVEAQTDCESVYLSERQLLLAQEEAIEDRRSDEAGAQQPAAAQAAEQSAVPKLQAELAAAEPAAPKLAAAESAALELAAAEPAAPKLAAAESAALELAAAEPAAPKLAAAESAALELAAADPASPELAMQAAPGRSDKLRMLVWRILNFALAVSILLLCFYIYELKKHMTSLQAELDLLGQPAEALRVERVTALAPTADSAGASGTVSLLSDAKGMHIIVNAESLPELRPNEAFQVWLSVDNKTVSAGTFYPSNGAGALYYLFGKQGAGGTIESVTITVEPDAKGKKPRGRAMLTASLTN
jgi:hypothetical protein